MRPDQARHEESVAVAVVATVVVATGTPTIILAAGEQKQDDDDDDVVVKSKHFAGLWESTRGQNRRRRAHDAQLPRNFFALQVTPLSAKRRATACYYVELL